MAKTMSYLNVQARFRQPLLNSNNLKIFPGTTELSSVTSDVLIPLGNVSPRD